MKNTIAFLFLFGILFNANAKPQEAPADSMLEVIQFVPVSLVEASKAAIPEKKAAKIADTNRVVVYDTVKVVTDTAKVKKSSKLPSSEDIPDISKIISTSKIFWSIVFLILAYFIIKILVIIVERFAEKSTTYRLTLKSLSPFIKIIGWIMVLFIIVRGIFQPPVETIIAVMASVGIAIGFAAQDILKNIFGGIMILFDRPFQVGDKIEVGNYYGEVKEIGLRSTRIVTKDDSLVSVPNAEVVNSAVSNANAGETNCQVVAEIYLPIDIDTNLVRQVATESAQISRYIYLNKPIVVLFFNEVKEKRSYIKMRLKAYVSDIRNEFPFQSDMTEIVMKELLKQGILKKEELL